MRTDWIKQHFGATMDLIGKSNREYTVHGEIKIVLNCPVSESSIALVRSAISEADKQHPWKDQYDKTGEEYTCTMILNDGPTGMNDWGPGCEEHYVWFKVDPVSLRLRKAQVHGYEQYLKKIVETVFSMHLPEVKDGSAILNTSKVLTVCASK